MGADKEHEYLLGYLNGYVKDINMAFKKYHATTDKSGTIPQLIISEK